jgi:A/G-specific adenine glycosylase
LQTKFGGRVPAQREELLSLPGVSDYVADAVLSFAFGRRQAVVDNPIARVLARCFGLPEGPEARRNRDLRRLAQRFVGSDSASHNFALLDLADAVCRPRSPDHARCPLVAFCCEANRIGSAMTV